MEESCPSVVVRRPAFLFRKGDTPAEESSVGTGSTTPDCEMTEIMVEESPEYRTPIVGYEVMEERARFTVFKVRVEHHLSGRNWFVYRRYTDFVRLNKKLRAVFPNVTFVLPPKRWFGSNFDPLFLEDRLLGLQTFADTIMQHKDISRSGPVRSFFCLDEPPGPEDSIEESWARCESLEDVVCQLQLALKDRTQEVELLKAEVSMLRSQQQALLKSLKLQCAVTSRMFAPYKPTVVLARAHRFNLAFLKMVERAVAEVVDSKSPNLLHIDAPRDNCCSPTNRDVIVLDDRSNGDGSTGSRERLPPLGGSNSLGEPDSSTPIKKLSIYS